MNQPSIKPHQNQNFKQTMVYKPLNQSSASTNSPKPCKFTNLDTRIELINRIENEAKENQEIWGSSTKMQTSADPTFKPLYKRLIEAKLGSSQIKAKSVQKSKRKRVGKKSQHVNSR